MLSRAPSEPAQGAGSENLLARRDRRIWRLANLKHSWAGLRFAWRDEGGFRNHVLGAVAMLVTLVVLRPEPIWWAVALLGSSLILGLELLNSAIERLIDHVDGRLHREIRTIKDMCSAAVVVASAGVFILGLSMIADTLGWLGG